MQQQLELVVTATTDATGAASFQFGAVPQSHTWWGTVQVADAPAAATFAAVVTTAGISNAGTAWGQWPGPIPYGVVRAEGREQLVVNAIGLVPSTQYACTWLGIMDDSGEPIAEFPTSVAFATYPTAALINERRTDAGVYTSALFPVSNVKGGRYVFLNHAAAATVINMVWSTLPTVAGGALVQCGQRIVTLPAGGAAVFQHAHLGDFLQITATRIGGGAVNLDVAYANIDSDRTIWNAIQGPTAGGVLPDVLFTATTTVVPGTVVLASSSDVFAGPCTWEITPGTGAVSWSAFLQAQDTAGVWTIIARASQGNTTADGPASLLVIVPPAPLRVSYTNGDASNRAVGTNLTASSWQ